MCLRPAIIPNPKFIKYQHNYCLLCFNGREVYQCRMRGDYFYPHDLPNYRTVGCNHSNIKQYYAVDMTGECIPLYIEVPCCKCPECAQQKQRDIRSRMVCEQVGHGDVLPLFLTLTYNNANLPEDGVSVSDVKYFLKRLHLYLQRSGKSDGYFRHILFSEYGSTTGRAHYHAILFGLDTSNFYGKKFVDEFIPIVEKAWNKGFVYIKHVTPKAFKYVSKYVAKDVFEAVPPFKNPNFWLGSRKNGGIGSACLSNNEFLANVTTSDYPICEVKIFDATYKISLPKFIRDKIYPTLAKFVPYDIQRSIKNLCYELAKLNYVRESALNDVYHIDKFDFVFPPELAAKFPMFSCWTEDLDLRYHFNDNFADFDVVGIMERISHLYNKLDNFYINLSEYYNCDAERSIILRKFQRYAEEQKRLHDSLDVYAADDSIRQTMLKDYKNRIKDLQ